MDMRMRDRRRCCLPAAPAILMALAAIGLPGCIMKQNETLEVGGTVPSPLRPKPTALGRDSDAPSVTSLERENWAQEDFVVASDMIAHRPTYARRNTRYEVSARASGRYPTLAEAITLPGGPSESEQIYDALTWPILIIPAAVLVPLGLVFEPWIPTVGRSPHWAYQRHTQGARQGGAEDLTGDPLVDRLGMPVIPPAEAAEMPWAPVPLAPGQATPEPVLQPSPTPGTEVPYVPPPEAVPAGSEPAAAPVAPAAAPNPVPPATAPGGQP